MARKPLPPKSVSMLYDPNVTARCLLLQTGSAAAAHAAIARNTGVLKKPKRDIPDLMLLLAARRYPHKNNCTDHHALLKVAEAVCTGADSEETLVRRLRRGLKKQTLAEFASHYAEEMQPTLGLK